MFFTYTGIASMLVALVLPAIIKNIGLKNTTFFLVVVCSLGQWGFIYGLQHHNYMICLLSRTVFGLSDCISIMQNTLICMWFTTNEIPLALALFSCLVKLCRGTADNLAAVVYNQHHDITQFFYVGLAMSVFSIFVSFALMYFLGAVIESNEHRDKK